MFPILSIIIPIYNSEKYLPKLLEELNKQNIKNGCKCEIILIDDGSKDGSYEICKKYAKNFKIIRQVNKGACVARNVGLKNSNGKYIAFIDSDDFISEDYIETILSACESDKDLITFGYFQVLNNDIEKKIDKDFRLNTKNEFYKAFFEQKYNTLWDKIFKKDIIDKFDICFDEKIVMGEDYVFILEFIKYVNTILVLEKCLYYYKYNEDSLCSNVTTKYLNDLDYMSAKNESFFDNFCQDEYLQIVSNRKMLESVFRAIGLCQKDKKNYEKEISSKIEECNSISKVIEFDYLNFKDKVIKFLIKNKFYKTIKILINIKHKK